MKKILLTTVMLSALIAGAIPVAQAAPVDLCGVPTPLGFDVAQNSMETASASGEATLTCHLPNSLVPRPGAGLELANSKVCIFKLGYNCSFDALGDCVTHKCTSAFCNDSACGIFCPKKTCG